MIWGKVFCCTTNNTTTINLQNQESMVEVNHHILVNLVIFGRLQLDKLLKVYVASYYVVLIDNYIH